MSEVFIGQIMMTAFGYAQKNFAQCNGQILAIQQNQALFSLIGTTYGGNGVQTFALPDLRSRTPAGGFGSANPSWTPPTCLLGEVGGTEQVTLLATQLPVHGHSVTVSSGAASSADFAAPNLTLAYAMPNTTNVYGTGNPTTALHPSSITPSGGGQPHANIQPYATINFNIALFGIFPSRN